MPIGTKNDMKIYDPRIRGGFVEVLLQNLQAFNAASRGSIRLVSARKPGNFEYESFFQNINGLIRRRDPNSTAAIADKKMTQGEFVSVKLNGGIGPVTMTMDSFRKMGIELNDGAMRLTAGQMAARGVVADYLNSGLRGVVGALNNTAAAKVTIGTGITTVGLTDGLAKFGDAANGIVAWVMHSKPYYDLVKHQMTEKITGISDFNIATAQPVTLNRPVLVTDSDALLVKDGGGNVTDYLTLGLVQDAVQVEDTESEMILFDPVTGLENLAYRMQGEYAFNLGVKGYAWDVANGGENPTDTALVTAGNWDPVLTDIKGRAGVIIQTK